MEPTPSERLVLRNLPLAARLTLALFLISIGVGYFSALVQLHFQHAKPGSMFPDADDAVARFHGPVGGPPLSKIERLLAADPNLPFNGSGQMAAAFAKRSAEWKSAIKAKAKALAGKNRGRGKAPLDLDGAEKALRQERDTERLAVIEWAKAGANKQEYSEDRFCLPEGFSSLPITDDYLVKEGGTAPSPRAVKIRSILADRCARCHTGKDAEDANAGKFPLDTYEGVKKYATVATSGAMTLEKLAQTTHAHLLSFSILYGLTGLILAFSSYPGWLRVLLCPLPLLAQVIDIGFWWLARVDGDVGAHFARAIPESGKVVAVGLALHILLSLFNLFGKTGKLVLILLIAGALGGGFVAKQRVIDPYLTGESTSQQVAPE